MLPEIKYNLIGQLCKPSATHTHYVFSCHIAQNFSTYVSMPSKFMSDLPTRSAAHLNDSRLAELPKWEVFTSKQL